MKLIILFSLVCVSLRSSGFLFDDITPSPSTGATGITDKHFVMIMEMLVQEKELRERYMLQLKQKILENENKTGFLETKMEHLVVPTCNNTNEDISNLEKRTALLLHNYKTLATRYENLENRFVSLQNNMTTIISASNSSKRELAMVKQELDQLKGLQSINQMEELKNLKNENTALKQQVQLANNRIDSVVSMQQSRGQDFLALYNSTIKTRSETTLLIKALEQNVTDLGLQQNRTSLRLKEDVSQLQSNQHELTLKLNLEMQHVALTLCAEKAEQIQPNFPMKFPDTVTSYGFQNLSTLQSSGLFECEIAGLYLISVTVMSYTAYAYYQVYRNSEYLVDVYTLSNLTHWTSGTATVIIQLNVNDIITVKPAISSDIYSHSTRRSTCITIVKIK